MRFLKLANGIPLILDAMPGTSAITALILFKVGSRYENTKNNGVSHFVEHLFFKGTTKRPSTLAISQELDGVGADYNAFTSKEFTGYYIKVFHENTELALDMLSDILFNPLFPPGEIEKERGVIVEEINMYEDNPMATVAELNEEVFFGTTHPLGYRIAGPQKNIQTINRHAIISYRDRFYHPGNMVMILTGKLPINTLRLVNKFFVQQNHHQRQPHVTARTFHYTQSRTRLHLQKKDTAQAHLVLSFPAPHYTAPNLPAAELLTIILGGNMSSRLFINVRDKQGLCYYINSELSPLVEIGLLAIRAGFDIDRLLQATRAISAEFVKLVKEPVTTTELNKAKYFIRGKMSIRLEDSENVASWWARQLLFHKTHQTPQQYLQAIQKVTPSQVQKLACQIFQKSQANLAMIGPFHRHYEKQLLAAMEF